MQLDGSFFKNQKFRGLEQFIDQYKFLFNEIPIWIAVLNEKNQVAFWSQGAEQISGYSKQEILLNDYIWNMFYPDESYYETVVELMKGATENSLDLDHIKTTIVTKSGQRKEITWKTNQILNQENANIGTFICSKNVELIPYESPNNVDQFLYLFDQMTIPLQMFDKDGNLKKTNKAWQQLWQVEDPESICGKYNIIHDYQSIRLGVADVFKEVVKGKSQYINRISYNPEKSSYKGRERVIKAKLFPYKSYNNEITGVIMASTDVTEGENTKRQLEVQSQKLQSTIEAIPDLMFVIDKNGIYQDFHAKDISILVVPPEDLIGNSIFDISPNKELAQTVFEAINKSLTENKLVSIEYQLEVQKGVRDFEGRITPYGLEEVLLIVRDVTERIIKEKKVNEAQKMDSIGALASGIAHDFNNMLGGISGFTSLLKNKEIDPKKLSHLEQIEFAVTRASELTQKLLNFSRKRSDELVSIYPKQVVTEVIALMKRSIKKTIKIKTIFKNNIFSLDAEQGQLNQIIMNLLVNAVEAIDSHGTITISLENITRNESDGLEYPHIETEHVKFEITDDGDGISEEIMNHIFEPFYTTKNSGEVIGTGLGLATVNSIIHNLGGQIYVESSIGVGTTFTILLPKGKLSKNNVSIKLEEKLNNNASGKVLIADDEEIILLMLAQMVRILGYETILAEDGESAVEKFIKHKNSIHCVILDLQMPKLDGYEAFKKIREINDHIEVILTTGFGKNESTKKYLNEGIKEILSKPFRIEDVARVINSLNK